jgi:two-component system, cell cycle response regulator DivK
MAIQCLPAIILMDIMMPEMSGFAAAAAIRRNAATGLIPIIALTANLFTKEEHEAARKLFDGYLYKPVTPSRVAAEVERLIGAPHTNDNGRNSITRNPHIIRKTGEGQ